MLSNPKSGFNLIGFGVEIVYNAPKLSRYSKDLFTLGKFEFGFAGGKLQKITPQECGANKHCYSKWKVFWDGVKKLIQLRYFSDKAINLISSVME